MEDDPKSAEGQSRRLEKVYEELAARMRQPDVMQEMHVVVIQGEWSPMQILGHMVEMIPYWLGHFREVMATAGELPKLGRSQDAPERLEGAERGAEGYPDKMLEQLREEILAAVSTFRSMSPSQREKKGVHTTRGEMTLAAMIDVFVVSHAEDHLEQIKSTIARIEARDAGE
jgi:septum formation topological specificity factor MinE